MTKPTHSVLFVCYGRKITHKRLSFEIPNQINFFFIQGNICRSPMAEAIFDHLAKKAGVRDKVSGSNYALKNSNFL